MRKSAWVPWMRLAAVPMSWLLCACDTLPHARVFNGTGAPITLHIDDGGMKHDVRLANGEARIVMAYGDPLEIVAGNCRDTYIWPPMSLNFPFELYKDGYPVAVQVQPDRLIYLLPYRTKSVAPSGSFKSIQAHGFPLRPTRSDCAADATHRR